MRRPHSLSLVLACLCVLLAGCPSSSSIVATDPAKQAVMDRHAAVAHLWTAYADGENLVSTLYEAGLLDRAAALAARNDLRTTVRPLIESAQAALVDGDPSLAIARATIALAQTLAPAHAVATPTTRPAAPQPGATHP